MQRFFDQTRASEFDSVVFRAAELVGDWYDEIPELFSEKNAEEKIAHLRREFDAMTKLVANLLYIVLARDKAFDYFGNTLKHLLGRSEYAYFCGTYLFYLYNYHSGPHGCSLNSLQALPIDPISTI